MADIMLRPKEVVCRWVGGRMTAIVENIFEDGPWVFLEW